MIIIDKIRHFTETRPRLAQVVFTAGVILIGLLVFVIMMATRSDVQRTRATMPPPLVSVIRADVGPRRVVITGEGTVRPLREINLVPQVSGKIVHMAPAMAGGGSFRKGEILLRIDPTDYELAVKSAEARVKDLESALLLTIEEAEVALEEWKLSGGKGEEPPPLVAKQPQLEAARANLAAGKADLEKAKLNLERTTLRAPFESRIIQKNVDLGQFVAVGQQLGSMYSIEAAEIAVPLPNEDLEWFHVPGFTPDGNGESAVTVHADIAGRDLTWTGRVMRAEGVLDERTRMVNIITRVERPYDSVPPLAMGLFVKVEIEGIEVPDAIWLPRSAVHERDTVWIVDGESRIRFRPVDIIRYDGDRVLVTGIEGDELVAISPIQIVTEGIKVNYEPTVGAAGAEMEAAEQVSGDTTKARPE
jgi:RND family efflux transporter MFP subunit